MNGETAQKHGVTGSRGPVYAAAVCICAASAAAAGYLALKYLPGILLPFLAAFLLSLCLRPAADKLCGAQGRRGFVSALLVLGGAGLLCAAAFFGVRQGMRELQSLLVRMTQPGDVPSPLAEAADWLRSASSHLPFLRRFEQSPGFGAFTAWLDGAVRSAAERLLLRVSGFLSDAAVSLFRGLPTALLWVTVLIMSCYYFTASRRPPWEYVLSRLPSAVRSRLNDRKAQGKHAAGRFLRAYLLLFLITLAEMLAGLLLLRKPYPLLGAAVIALVDLLPVLGTGAVLLPWALLDCLSGHIPTGLGLLALYGISLLLRQVLEPRLVGDSLGIHPLLSLAAVWVGYRLFGLTGMVLAPLAAVLVKSLFGTADAAPGRSETAPP